MNDRQKPEHHRFVNHYMYVPARAPQSEPYVVVHEAGGWAWLQLAKYLRNDGHVGVLVHVFDDVPMWLIYDGPMLNPLKK